jgi:hypothetical protein
MYAHLWQRSQIIDVLISAGGRPQQSGRRGVHRSVTALEKDILGWIEQWNTNPKPYVWTRTADQILESLAAYCRRISDDTPLGRVAHP